MFSRAWILATLLVFAGTAFCIRMGIWQLDRLEQRRAFNAQVISMRAAESYAYSCSFQPGQYFGLDVHEALTTWTRVYGILFSGIPLGVLIALYALIMPVKKK